jgi:hypothetical protein
MNIASNKKIFFLLLVVPLHFLYLSYSYLLNIFLYEVNIDSDLHFFTISNFFIILLFFIFVSIKKTRDDFMYIGKKSIIPDFIFLSLVVYGIIIALPVAQDMGFFNRSVRKELFYFFEGSFWAFSRILIIVSFIKICQFDKTKKILIYLFLALFLDMFLLGGRRLFLSLLIVFFFFKLSSLNARKVIILFFIFFLVFLFGAIREFIFHGEEVQLTQSLLQAINSNEFEVVSLGNYYYYNIADNIGNALGSTYTSFINYFINFFIGEANTSVGREYGYFIGYYSELMLNFGPASFIASFLFFLIFSYFFFYVKNRVILFFLVSFSMEFLRTSFGEMVLSFFIFLVFWILIHKTIRYGNAFRISSYQ